ncbi:MAG TPA: hypothetical protein VES19_16390 [Candidatus Limnocylindrales bacterium]|nr:hypothetical protein [Candidatus Limnocylindrales bacterium]
MSGEVFPVDDRLLASACERLRSHAGLRYLLGGSGTGKSTVAGALRASLGIDVIDMDARIYGTWGDRWDPARHPATSAWLSAADPLAWQLALEPEDFLRFHAAATVEALDLLADEQEESVVTTLALIDGGFGSLAAVALAVPPGDIVCLALPPGSSEAVWAADMGRRSFLEVVAAVVSLPDPVARFLALDAALSERMVTDARQAGVAVIERAPGTSLEATARAVAGHLGLD